jgi:hypothetical protein
MVRVGAPWPAMGCSPERGKRGGGGGGEGGTAGGVAWGGAKELDPAARFSLYVEMLQREEEPEEREKKKREKRRKGKGKGKGKEKIEKLLNLEI